MRRSLLYRTSRYVVDTFQNSDWATWWRPLYGLLSLLILLVGFVVSINEIISGSWLQTFSVENYLVLAFIVSMALFNTLPLLAIAYTTISDEFFLRRHSKDFGYIANAIAKLESTDDIANGLSHEEKITLGEYLREREQSGEVSLSLKEMIVVFNRDRGALKRFLDKPLLAKDGPHKIPFFNMVVIGYVLDSLDLGSFEQQLLAEDYPRELQHLRGIPWKRSAEKRLAVPPTGPKEWERRQKSFSGRKTDERIRQVAELASKGVLIDASSVTAIQKNWIQIIELLESFFWELIERCLYEYYPQLGEMDKEERTIHLVGHLGEEIGITSEEGRLLELILTGMEKAIDLGCDEVKEGRDRLLAYLGFLYLVIGDYFEAMPSQLDTISPLRGLALSVGEICFPREEGISRSLKLLQLALDSGREEIYFLSDEEVFRRFLVLIGSALDSDREDTLPGDFRQRVFELKAQLPNWTSYLG